MGIRNVSYKLAFMPEQLQIVFLVLVSDCVLLTSCGPVPADDTLDYNQDYYGDFTVTTGSTIIINLSIMHNCILHL